MSAESVAQALRQLVETGGDGNRLVVSRGPAWFHCTAANGDRSILVEPAPSASLPKDRALTPNRIQHLRRLGYASRPGHRCLGRLVALDEAGSIDGLGQELMTLFASVYEETDGPVQTELHLGDRERAANPKLIEAMRVMAKKRDHKYRTGLYRALLDSTLLLMVDGEPRTPTKVGELMRYDVYAAFTSWDALRRFQPRGAAYTSVRGRHLFGQLLEHNVGSLLIDPKSTVGGELYRNELETLAGASYGTRRR